MNDAVHFGSGRKAPPKLRCSFCHKEQSEVGKLIAGPDVFICNECVQCCVDIIRADGGLRPVAADTSASAVATHSTDPTEIVRCRLCNQELPWDEALEIPERGFLCAGCTGEVDAALEQKHAVLRRPF